MLKHLRQSNTVLKYLITAILIFVPLYIKFPLFRIPGTYVSIRMEDFLVGITTLYLVVFCLKDLIKTLNKKIGRSMILFWMIGFISLLSAIFITQTAQPMLGALHLLRRVEYMILFFAGYIFLTRNTEQNMLVYLIKVLLLVNLFIFIYGMGQRFLQFPVIVTQNEEYSKGIALRWINGAHVNSTFAGHYDLASYLLLTMPVFICLFFLLKDKLQKLLVGLSIGMCYWLLASAASRISIASFLLAMFVSLILIKKYKAIILMLAISFLIFGTSPALKARYMRIFQVTKERLSAAIVVQAQAPEVFEDRSTSIRLNVEWPRALRAFKKNPLLGTGYSSINLATDNDYLRALGEVGLLGFSAFGLIFIHIWKYILKIWHRIAKLTAYDQAFIAGITGGIVGTLTNAIFIDIFEASKFATIFWLFIGIMIARIRNKPNEQRN